MVFVLLGESLPGYFSVIRLSALLPGINDGCSNTSYTPVPTEDTNTSRSPKAQPRISTPPKARYPREDAKHFSYLKPRTFSTFQTLCRAVAIDRGCIHLYLRRERNRYQSVQHCTQKTLTHESFNVSYVIHSPQTFRRALYK